MSDRKKDNPEAMAVRCPYCGAGPGEDCRVRQPQSVYTVIALVGGGGRTRDHWGWPTLHRARINAASKPEPAAA